MKKILSPSILAADFAALGAQVKQAHEAGAEYIHIDVMDGVFVPSISFGMPIISALRPVVPTAIFDVHLMIVHPKRYIEEFKKCGADLITFHYEACDDEKEIIETIELIRACGCKVGLSIKPKTPIDVLKPFLSMLDMILIMSVEPGFGGQSYIPESTQRIELTAKLVAESGYPIDIEVDGGIKTDNVSMVTSAGANIIVAGTAIFKGNIEKNVEIFTEVM